MALLVLEHTMWKIRAAINTDLLLDEMDVFTNGLRAATLCAHRSIDDFLRAWHGAEDKSAVPIPSWVVYVHVDETIGLNGLKDIPR